MSEAKAEAILDAEQRVNEALPYLNKLSTLQSINNLQSQPNINQDRFDDKSGTLALRLRNLLQDYIGYRCNFKDESYDNYNNNQKGFFGFYDYAQKWLKFKCEDEKVYKDQLKELKLDEPYRLAIELFVEYVNFRKTAENGAQYENGYNNNDGSYQPNIRDLFTDEDLIKLGGNEFIKDCYEKIGIKFSKDIQKNIERNHRIKKPQIQNIDSRTGKELKSNKDVKPNLYERVDKHLSWKIFKDGKVKNLTNDEVSILKEAMKNEGFWKHLGKTELKILPVTGGIALILGLVAAFAFGATGGALLALILTPIGAGALVIAPSVTPISQRSAIVDNMIEIGNKNKEFNNKLKQGEERYRQYKDNNPDFLKPEPEEEKNIKEKEEENMINIGSLQENNKIIPKSNIKPLNMAANQQEENNTVENNKESEKENK